ncbi:desulfoferrodoxin family protein [Paludicola sp. MB14-C6]|uniref:desulfoferrodoxin family protein n=1 Tax=Paludihabitans sp. MB14-C6 TaxID=3070656 RepID=UPI0027DBA331|nr:desulfoferrodoxin family protein [Paludicola sp. MB14-C6]WMJ24011.1 desulfoferrodoxin family protein [Paludicola sp. MB14-C6]
MNKCQDSKFFVCKHCGNLIGTIHSSGVPIICCGEEMEQLNANVTDAAVEKHIPVVSIENNIVNVKIGEIEHPMSKEHHIEWVYVEIQNGGQRKCLAIETKPELSFAITDDDKVVGVYAYCNLHGLWKKEM